MNLDRQEEKLRLARLQLADPDGLGHDLDPAEYRAARWIADLWKAHCRPGMHLRAIFYLLFSRQVLMAEGVRQHDRVGAPAFDLERSRIALPLENTAWHWKEMCKASVLARYARMIPAHELEEHRSPDPVTNFYPREYPVPDVEWTDDDIPRPRVTGYDWERSDDQGYSVELWCEKSTMDHIFDPLCRKLGINYQAGQGYLSITRVVQLLKRTQRPMRLFFISDFDGSGINMPGALFGQIERLADEYAPGVEIKMMQLALTEQQVREYQLPFNRIDPDRSEKGLKKVFAERYPDLGPVELDALEGLHPGVLEALVREAVKPYIDDSLQKRLDVAKTDAQTAVDEAWDETIESDLDDLDETAVYQNRVDEQLRVRSDRMVQPLVARQERLRTDHEDRRTRAHLKVYRRIDDRYAKLMEPYERRLRRLKARQHRHIMPHLLAAHARRTRIKHQRQFRVRVLDGVVSRIRGVYDSLIERVAQKVSARVDLAHEHIDAKREDFEPPFVDRPTPTQVDDHWIFHRTPK